MPISNLLIVSGPYHLFGVPFFCSLGVRFSGAEVGGPVRFLRGDNIGRSKKTKLEGAK